MVLTMLQCSNTRWTRLLELGFISKICLDEWNSLSLMIENLYPCSFNCLSSAAIITLKLSGSKSSQFLSFTSASSVSSSLFSFLGPFPFFLFFSLNYVFNTFRQKDEHLRADVCKNRANGGHGQKLKFAHILSIVRY